MLAYLIIFAVMGGGSSAASSTIPMENWDSCVLAAHSINSTRGIFTPYRAMCVSPAHGTVDFVENGK